MIAAIIVFPGSNCDRDLGYVFSRVLQHPYAMVWHEEKNIPKVFRRFYREDSSRGKEPGNGLGLSLVAAVVKVHRATITLQNTWPGLQVTLNFPVSVAG